MPEPSFFQSISVRSAAGYIRVSRAEQAEHGHSMDAQHDLIHQYAQQRGWNLVQIYQDPGISGTRDDRPALRQLLADAETGLFDVVVVHAIDRFYRDLVGLLAALNHLYKHNVSFISITENIDFTTPWGKLALAVLGTLAEIYIDKLSAETKKGKRQRAIKGLYNGLPPLGYCKGNCSTCTDPNGQGYCPRFGQADLCRNGEPLPLYPHPIESRAVQLAYEWYLSGTLSDGDIADRLNAYRLPLPDDTTCSLRTKGVAGRNLPAAFSKSSVRELLQHPIYIGKVPYYGRDENGRRRKRTNPESLYDGQHAALISAEQFRQVQSLRQMASHRNRDSSGLPQIYPLSGILACWRCRRKMRASSSNGHFYYNDVTRIEHLGDCNQPAVPAIGIEMQIVQLLSGISLSPDWQDQLDRQLCTSERLSDLKTQESRLKDRIERVTELYLDGDIDKERYQEERRACDRAMSNLYPPEKSSIIQAGLILEQFGRLWANASESGQKNRLLRSIVIVAFISGPELVAIQLTDPFFALVRFWRYGSDGI